MNCKWAFLAFLSVAVPASPATPAAGYEATLSSDDADFAFRFPGKPSAFAEAQKTTDDEYGVSTRFAYGKPGYSLSVALMNFHRVRTSGQTAALHRGVLASLNGKRKDSHLQLEDLAVVTLGNWKGRQLYELDGKSANQIRFFALPHGLLAIMARWNVDDPAAVKAVQQFMTPAIRSLITPAQQTRTPPQIEFFYEGIRPTLAVAHRLIGRARQCSTLFVDKCELPPELAKGGTARMQQLFGVLSHAGIERLAPLPKPEIRDQVMAEFPGMRAWFNDELLTGEKELFAKLAAVFEVCPGERSGVLSARIPAFEEVNFTRFWEQSRDVYARTSASIARRKDEIRKQIENGWSGERCASTYEVAQKLAGVVFRKTKPFVDKDWQTIPRGERFSSGASFAWELAYTLEYHLDPGIDDRLDPASAYGATGGATR